MKGAVIESLQFRRADRFVTQILSTAPDEVWQQLARKGYADEVADWDAADRLRVSETGWQQRPRALSDRRRSAPS